MFGRYLKYLSLDKKDLGVSGIEEVIKIMGRDKIVKEIVWEEKMVKDRIFRGRRDERRVRKVGGWEVWE